MVWTRTPLAPAEMNGHAVGRLDLGDVKGYTANGNGAITPPPEAPPPPGGFSTLLRTRKRWIIGITAAAVAGAAFVSSHRVTTFRSHAEVVVEPITYANVAPSPPNMGTEKQVATSSAVADMAAAQLHIPPGAAAKGLSVGVPVDANVLDFRYSSDRPADARRRVTAFADSYVRYRAQGAAAPAAKTATAGGGNKATPVPSGTVRGEVITASPPPVSSVKPNYVLNIGFALVVGLILGIGSAALRDRLDDRIRGPEDLAARSRALLLGAIPRTGRRRRAAESSSAHPGLVTIRDTDAATVDAYRRIRGRLLRLTTKRDAKIVAVTSAGSVEGKTTVAANLAAVLAESGGRVVMVDADLRHPSAHELFGLDNGIGLSDVLLNRAAVPEALRDTYLPGLRLLSTGPATDACGDLFAGPRFHETLATLTTDADFIVIDSTPVLASADAIEQIDRADVAVLVASARRSSRRRVSEASAELGWVERHQGPYPGTGGRLAGAVLIDARGGSA